jgi:uncharacterized protein (TIGR02444 family)
MSRSGKGAAARLAAGSADPSELGAELWTFALSFYRREEVSKACLVLQERIGADVDVVLFGLFALLRKRVSLAAGEIRTIDALANDWRSEIVRPLRQLRTRLKSGPSPAPSASTDELRNRIKSIEIEAERIELGMLAGWLAQREPHRDAAPADPGALLELIARHFAGEAGRPIDDPLVQLALHTLAHAANDIAAERPASTAPHPD